MKEKIEVLVINEVLNKSTTAVVAALLNIHYSILYCCAARSHHIQNHMKSSKASSGSGNSTHRLPSSSSSLQPVTKNDKFGQRVSGESSGICIGSCPNIFNTFKQTQSSGTDRVLLHKLICSVFSFFPSRPESSYNLLETRRSHRHPSAHLFGHVSCIMV